MKDKEKQDYTQVQARLLAKHLIESENRRKEKQIEEMQKTLCTTDCQECMSEYLDFLKEHNLCNDSTTEMKKRCIFHEQAEKLYNAGYRKIDEDSVVISREEYERLKRVEVEKDRLYEIKLDLENQLIEKGWTDYEGADEIEKRVSKETAEYFLKEYGYLLSQRAKDEIVQKFGVEIKE